MCVRRWSSTRPGLVLQADHALVLGRAPPQLLVHVVGKQSTSLPQMETNLENYMPMGEANCQLRDLPRDSGKNQPTGSSGFSQLRTDSQQTRSMFRGWGKPTRHAQQSPALGILLCGVVAWHGVGGPAARMVITHTQWRLPGPFPRAVGEPLSALLLMSPPPSACHSLAT